MDPVSRVLIEAERRRSPLLPWVFLAVFLHICLAGGVYLLGRRNPRVMAAHLPVVSVHLIRTTTRPKPRAASRPAPRPTAAPVQQPTPLPEPTPPGVPEKKPPQSTASQEAVPTLESRRTPAPTPVPAASSTGGVTRGGLSLGSNAAENGETGIPSDFQFTYYLERMLALIESHWFQPPVPVGTSARARFTIESSGHVRNIVLESSSGNSAFDRAVLRALFASNPLPPLPPAYRRPSLTIHLNFSHRR